MVIPRATALRGVTHVAAWIPFLAAVAVSARGSWRVAGDGAAIALRSWDALTAHGPLVGQATRLGHGLYDPGPLQFWLLAIPVHLDPARGVLWGATLWCMAAGSVAIEAAWAVRGAAGGILASGAILGVIAWTPGLAIRPYWNPWFGTMFFIAALAAGWAVGSGRRGWWPVVVITASVAAQAHLMFTIACAALVLLTLITGLVSGFAAKAGYRWAVAGLIAGMACWSAPLIQQFTSRTGNFTALLHHAGAGPRTGLTFALKALAFCTQPPPLGWMSSQSLLRLNIARLIDGRSAIFAVAVLAVTAAVILLAVFWLRSRRLASLAALSLLVSAAGLATFASIPVRGNWLSALSYLIIVLFLAGLLFWLIVGSAFALMCQRAIKRVRVVTAGRAEPDSRLRTVIPAWTPSAARIAGAAAVLVFALASVAGVVQRSPVLPQDARLAQAIGAASGLIGRALPPRQMALTVVGANIHFERRLTLGLVWALSADGYHPEVSARYAVELGRLYLFHRQQIPQVKVLVRDSEISVKVTKQATGGVPGA